MSTIEGLPALIINVSGSVISSNANQFRDYALGVLNAIPRKFETDQDFADAELRVKWCKSVEEKLQLAKSGVQNQMADIDAIFTMIDEVSSATRNVRLEFEKLVSARKQEIKDAIISSARREWDSYLHVANEQIAPCKLPIPMPDFLGVTKGKRTIESIQRAVDAAVVNQKIAADSAAERIKANLAVVRNAGNDLLFADIATLCLKDCEVVSMTVKQRLSDHKAAQERAAQERAAQERATQERAAQERAAQERATQEKLPVKEESEFPQNDESRLFLGDIFSRLGFIFSTSLEDAFGISPSAAAGSGKKPYSEAQFTDICDALIKHIEAVKSQYKK